MDVDDSFGHWFAGFTDGEGCFDIKGVGEHYICRFTIGLRVDDRPILEEIQAKLGLGSIYKRTTASKHNDQVAWEVTRKTETAQLVHVFDRYPLRAKKAIDFAIWREAVFIWNAAVRGNRYTGRSPHTAQLCTYRQELKACRKAEPELDLARLL